LPFYIIENCHIYSIIFSAKTNFILIKFSFTLVENTINFLNQILIKLTSCKNSKEKNNIQIHFHSFLNYINLSHFSDFIIKFEKKLTFIYLREQASHYILMTSYFKLKNLIRYRAMSSWAQASQQNDFEFDFFKRKSSRTLTN
jgi:hypothetical protein